jgi:penicillin amidase
MDYMARLASGRLSQLLGKRFLESDLFFMKLGMVEAAKESAEMMLQDPITGPALVSYAAGVNAYIASLKPARLPFEYKFLNQTPEPWTPLKSALILKLMAWNLSNPEKDILLTRSRLRFTQAEFDELYPLNFDKSNRTNNQGKKRSDQIAIDSPDELFQATLSKLPTFPHEDPFIQLATESQQWAVFGKRSSTGEPLLAASSIAGLSDLRFNQTAPSVWYEMQLSLAIPDRQNRTQHNVYGMSLPGIPGIMVGFNEQVAWSFTKGDADLVDWYEIRYRDERRSEYLFEGSWRPVISTDVVFAVRDIGNMRALARRTHIGPVMYDEYFTDDSRRHIHQGLAVRWSGLSPENSLRTYLLLNRAGNVSGCQEALSSLTVPSLHVLCTDRFGAVAQWLSGRTPLRWTGQGRLIADGSKAEYEWQGWIPHEELPGQRKNSESGFMLSTSQDPHYGVYPYYLGWPFEFSDRDNRLNQILKVQKSFGPQEIIEIQADTTSPFAQRVLSVFLKNLNSDLLAKHNSFSKHDIEEGLKTLRTWNFRFNDESVGAALYEVWFRTFLVKIWRSHFPGDQGNYFYPLSSRVLEIIEKDPDSKWFDDPSTSEYENIQTILVDTLIEAHQRLEASMRDDDPEDWTWGGYQDARFAKPGTPAYLSASESDNIGSEHSGLSVTDYRHPGWKLVVALGETPKAWGIYGGGQSADMTSPYFDTFIERWSTGNLKEIHYLRSVNSELQNQRSSWRLNGISKVEDSSSIFRRTAAQKRLVGESK